MAKKKAAAKPRVGVEDFIKAYCNKKNDTYAAVAKALGISEASVKQRYYLYKKKGMKLEAKASGMRDGRKLNVKKLNELIESLS